MKPVNVLVIFSSSSGRTERLALAAAVGAVQERARIRIRRLPETAQQSAVSTPTLLRMRREYVSPTAADAIWADAVIVGITGKIAGDSLDPEAATAYGRRVVADARQHTG
jgi:NAD(P)H dehydrogenase (quinone)